MTQYQLASLLRLCALRSGGALGRFAQVKEEPAKRAGDTEQNALPPRLVVV